MVDNPHLVSLSVPDSNLDACRKHVGTLHPCPKLGNESLPCPSAKKERTLSIWIGLAIGITLSSLLFRYALNEKEAKTRQRPGNFDTTRPLKVALSIPFPRRSQKDLRGIVVFFDKNESICESHAAEKTPKWVIETSGAFRSERLFVLIEQNPADKNGISFFPCFRTVCEKHNRIGLAS